MKYYIDVKKFLNFLAIHKEELKTYLGIEEFKNHINTTFNILKNILANDFDDQENTDELFVEKSNNYWFVNYYKFCEITAEGDFLAYSMVYMIIREDISEIYFVSDICDLNYDEITEFINKKYGLLINREDVISYYRDINFMDLESQLAKHREIHDEIDLEVSAPRYKKYKTVITKYYLDKNKNCSISKEINEKFNILKGTEINNLLDQLNTTLVKK